MNGTGGFFNDYAGEDAAFKLGIDPKSYGTCDHAISVDGSDYEIGVVKRTDGKGYSLVWDFYGTGQNINKRIGDGAEKLLVQYQKQYLHTFAEEMGAQLTSQETADETLIEIEVNT